MVMATNEMMDHHGTDMTVASPKEFHSLGKPTLNPLVLLLHVETLDGSLLPEKFLTILNCHDLSNECREEEPYKVELLSAYEACLTYKENVIIADLEIRLMAVETWIGLPIVITAVILNRDKVDQIILVRQQGRKEREVKANARLAVMQEEQEALKYKLNRVSDKEAYGGYYLLHCQARRLD